MITNFGFGAFANAPVPPIGAGYYGSFYDTTNQIIPANTATAMTMNTTDISNGVSIVAGSQITVANTGVYNLQFSAQMFRTAGGTKETLDIWLRKNGLNVPNSDTKISFANNGIYVVAAWNWLVQLNAGENCEIMWAVSANTIRIVYEPEDLVIPHPAIPSVIVTCVQV